MGQITPFPDRGPALRVLSGNTATEEQRRVSAVYPGKTSPPKSRAVGWLSAVAVLLATLVVMK
jgi:hypothetical protein